MKSLRPTVLFYSLIIIILNSTNLLAQESNNNLKILTPEDYGKWERLGGVTLSNNGQWVTYRITTQDKDTNTFVYNTLNKTSQEFKNVSKANISKDGNWLSYNKVLSGKEIKKLSKNKSKDKKQPPINSVLYNLKTKDTIELKGFQSITFCDIESFVAMKRSEGNTLIIKNLNTSKEVSFGNVKNYSWQEDSTFMAMLIETKDKVGNAIQLYNAASGKLTVLDQEMADYSGLKWLKESDELFVTKKIEDKKYENETYQLLLWKNLNSNKSSLHVFKQSNYKNFPLDTRILNTNINISEDANAVYFSTFSWEKKTTENNDVKTDSIPNDSQTKDNGLKDDKVEAPDLEIWNSKDVVIIPAQKKSRMKDLEEPFNAVWNVEEDSFIALGDQLVENINLQIDNKIMIGTDRTPYDFEAMFGRPSYDIYTVNSKTGEKIKVLENVTKTWNVSPNNNFFTYLKNDNIHLFDISEGTSSNITENLDGTFIDFENDHPLPQKGAYGFGEWTKDSKSFFLYDEFNVWQIFTNGSRAKKLTDGKPEGIVYRIKKLDKTQKEIDARKPLYFSMWGKYTKKNGIAKGIPSKNIEILFYENASINIASSKLKNSDNMLVIKQTYQDSPNLYLTDTKFKNTIQISNTNAFQKNYAWGKAELIEFENALGKKAQGILYYPANYKNGEKYPMITYIYEKLSNGLHKYKSPSKYDYYNTTVWSQNGYFVLYPDIDFITGEPGTSSTKTLENAVKAVVDLGLVDSNKVGLIGHSWGGYQAGYVPTQTNIFAASVAGAGLTELISMNLAVTPAFGGRPENDHFEVGQERMGTAPWISPDNYLKNSSVMQIENLNTPILFEVGDNDTNVNWTQGIAYYNAARRAAKPFVLLVYANEGHGLRSEKNKYDYQQRILKWFGHYLKGEEAEKWITTGIPYSEQLRNLKTKY